MRIWIVEIQDVGLVSSLDFSDVFLSLCPCPLIFSSLSRWSGSIWPIPTLRKKQQHKEVDNLGDGSFLLLSSSVLWVCFGFGHLQYLCRSLYLFTWKNEMIFLFQWILCLQLLRFGYVDKKRLTFKALSLSIQFCTSLVSCISIFIWTPGVYLQPSPALEFALVTVQVECLFVCLI